MLSSLQNPLMKDIRRAVARGGLTDDGLCVAESPHLLQEALDSGCDVPVVLCLSSAKGRVEQLVQGRGRIVEVDEKLLASLSSTETSQGVIALVQPPQWQQADLFRGTPLVLVADRLQDPGNLGTMLRAAEAFGATGALLAKGTVSAYNAKCVRASAGSLFRLPFLNGLAGQEVLAMLSAHGCTTWVAQAGAGLACWHADFEQPCAIVIGNEGQGVQPALQAGTQPLQIPTQGVESLNAAAAAVTLLYEAHRQRANR